MLKLYNSLSKQIADFKPINPPLVGMYSCGPTVYQFAHIGNFRTYTTSDILVRALRSNGYKTKFVMNITDVGHMTQDTEGGGDIGEDKIEKTARKEGRSVWEVAKFYTDAFLEDYKALKLTEPSILAKATDHIQEQIDLIRVIEDKGFTYETSEGIYFDTSMLADYGKLSSLDRSREGESRLQANDEKRNPRDFALWKFSYPKKSVILEQSGKAGAAIESPAGDPISRSSSFQDDKINSLTPKRQMEWKSPWGEGFPGWHIECTAMSMKYLGETFDIHTGGADHKEIHHPNEIAQAEAATHKPLAHYWLHTAFMLVAGQKMSKSLGNTYTLYDLEKEGYSDPLVLRYLYLQTHYRQEMNFTFPALDAAQNAMKKLRQEVALWDEPRDSKVAITSKDREECAEFEKRFFEAVNDDLNMPQALAIMWELVKSKYPTAEKAKSLFAIDKLLGFDLQAASLEIKKEQNIVPNQVKELVQEREKYRREKRFNMADNIRAKIEKLGYEVEDVKKGPVKVRKKVGAL